jgi:hypothetical protein
MGWRRHFVEFQDRVEFVPRATASCLRGPLNPLRRSGGVWFHRKESLARRPRYRGCGFDLQQVV